MTRRNFLATVGSGVAAYGATAFAQDGGATNNTPAAPPDKGGQQVKVTIASGSKSARLRVRPAARGGKYLGHDAADPRNLSALVALQDPRTSQIVAYEFTQAPTPQSAGPANLMEPVSRSMPFPTDEHSVVAQLNVSVAEPTTFRLLVYGPLKHLDQARLVQSDITVIPGVDIGMSPDTPEGLVIEIPGLCIGNVTADWHTSQLSCTAEVTMMCGCPIHQQAGWFWPDTDFSIQLVTYMHSGAQHFYPMAYDQRPGTVSTFTGTWASQARPGDRIRQVWVYAVEPKLGNQGSFRVFPPQPAKPSFPAEVRQLLQNPGRSRPNGA
jgi:uncharacterized Zn-binding protein involved in type VI secretion